MKSALRRSAGPTTNMNSPHLPKYPALDKQVLREISISSQQPQAATKESRRIDGLYEFGPFRLDVGERCLMQEGELILLAPKVFETLRVLVQSAGHLVNKDTLMQEIWTDTFVEEANLTQNVCTLRKLLNVCDEMNGFIETVPGRGYRFTTAVREVSESEARADLNKHAGPGAAETSRGQVASPYSSLAVLPLANETDDASLEYLSDGITECLISRLSRLPQLRVMAAGTVFRYKGRPLDLQAVGLKLKVAAVLTGRLLRVSDRLYISLELVDTARGWRMWGASYDRQASDIFDVQDEIGQEVSDQLRLKLSGEDRKLLTKRYTDNSQAYKLYLKGRYYWNQRTEQGLKQGIEHFQQALESDPTYALAYAGLADCFILLCEYGVCTPIESYPRGKAAALKALSLDDSLAEAHASLGLASMFYDWKGPIAEQEFQRAIELNPSYATAYQWRAISLAITGRFDEAIAEIKRAQELDPLSRIINANVARVYYFADRYEEALEQCRLLFKFAPEFSVAHKIAGFVYVQKNMYAESAAHLQKAIELSGGAPEIVAALGYVHAISDNRGEARAALARLQQISERRYVMPLAPALVHLGLGEKDQSLLWLEKAYEERSDALPYLPVLPAFRSLHDDPRFVSLIERIGRLSALVEEVASLNPFELPPVSMTI